MREQRRLELEAEQCTFQPSLGGGEGGSGRRSSSAEPRNRRATTGGSGVGPPAGSTADSFSARSTAFLEAREQRLNRLRQEKIKLELQEATFHPDIGSGGVNARGGVGGGGGGGGDGNVSVAAAEIEAAVADGGRGVVAPERDMGVAQMKEVERKGSVGFKVGLFYCVLCVASRVACRVCGCRHGAVRQPFEVACPSIGLR